MKRTSTMKVLTIGLLTVSAFALSACQEDDQATSFKNVDQCISAAMNVDAGFTADDCRKGFEAAVAENKVSAPRYDAMALCEEEHGAGACQVEQRSDGSSVFLPLMMGYMMGSWNIDKDHKSYAYAPVYPLKSGGYATASGGYYTSSYGAKSYASPSALSAKAAPTYKSAPMTRVSIASKGGFGARVGGFGG